MQTHCILKWLQCAWFRPGSLFQFSSVPGHLVVSALWPCMPQHAPASYLLIVFSRSTCKWSSWLNSSTCAVLIDSARNLEKKVSREGRAGGQEQFHTVAAASMHGRARRPGPKTLRSMRPSESEASCRPCHLTWQHARNMHFLASLRCSLRCAGCRVSRKHSRIAAGLVFPPQRIHSCEVAASKCHVLTCMEPRRNTHAPSACTLPQAHQRTAGTHASDAEGVQIL